MSDRCSEFAEGTVASSQLVGPAVPPASRASQMPRPPCGDTGQEADEPGRKRPGARGGFGGRPDARRCVREAGLVGRGVLRGGAASAKHPATQNGACGVSVGEAPTPRPARLRCGRPEKAHFPLKAAVPQVRRSWTGGSAGQSERDRCVLQRPVNCVPKVPLAVRTGPRRPVCRCAGRVCIRYREQGARPTGDPKCFHRQLCPRDLFTCWPRGLSFHREPHRDRPAPKGAPAGDSEKHLEQQLAESL